MGNIHNNASQNRTEQNRTEQNRTEQNRTEQNRTDIDFDIPIFQKIYDFYKLLYQYIKLFPKKDKYSLGEKLDRLSLNIFETVITAGTTSKEKKLPFIEKAIVHLDILKILLRLSKDIQALENKKYIQLIQLLQEIGRMLGGWRRSLKEL